jgi:hypothetical protein
MPLTEAQEKKIGELRQGITDAPVAVVHNNRSCLLELLAVVDQAGKLSPEHEKAVAEVKANVAAGASVLSNSRATLLALFDAIDAAKAVKPVKTEPKV